MNKIKWDTEGFEDPSLYGNNFIHTFNQLLDVHAPITKTKCSKKQNKKYAKPWISNDILKLIKAKDKMFRKFTKEKNNDLKNELLLKYKKKKMK